MTRQSLHNIEINTNLRCSRIYPVEGTSKNLSDLKTVGIKISSDQAIHLARALLLAAQDWSEMELTAYRTKRRSDDTYQITLTSNP